MLRSSVILCLLIGCTRTTPTTETPKTPRKTASTAHVTVAVAPLATLESTTAWMGVAIADQLNQRLFARNDLGSITSRQVDAAMREARLTPTDLTKPEAVRKVAGHLGARFFVVGNVETLGKRQARIVEVETGRTRTVELDGDLSDMERLVDLIAKPLAEVVGGELNGVAPPKEALTKTTQALMILRQQSLSPRAADPVAKSALSAKDLTEARKLASAATMADPTYGNAWAALALTYALGDNPKRAWELLDKAGSQPTPILTRAFVRMREGRVDEAEKILRDAVEKHPGFLHARGSLAELLVHYGRMREARAVFREYLMVAPDQPWVLAKVGYCNAKLGKVHQAVDDTKQALAIVPSSAYLMTELASRQIDAEDLESAQKTLEGVLKLAPEDARAHVRLGYVQLVRGDDAGAIKTSTRAIELAKGPRHNRDRAYAHLNLARALGHGSKVNDALTHLERALGEADISIDELELDPTLDAMRKDPRYAKLLD